jgi:tRNA nucleotidyltransferase/poly(A) polymerase
MADYIYLLEHRLSAAQQSAIHAVREAARAQGLTVFLVGGAVRDLTSGSPVRDLDVVVQGNALTLKRAIEAAGGVMTGELGAWQALFVRFPGGVRLEIGSTLSVSYPKPGRPVMEPATILDDLRRRDFTANAMALSLNEGSYGLLMDPLNGVADIENRQLRLVSNYGFIEDPARMVRAARFAARLGWTMDEKTQARYDTGKQEHYIKALDAVHRGYETEEIFHEEDPLRILRKLEEEGWMKHLFPELTVAKANAGELDKLREAQTQLQMRGIHPEAAAANFPLLTAKLAASDLAALKKSFVRPGFAAEIDALEGEAKELSALLSGKGAALPSQAWKLLQAAKPEAVLWVAYSSKSAVVQAKLKSFHTEWPKARQRIPYTLMQEMRIVPELEGFDEIVEKLFYELMDGKLETTEEMKAFLEPFSPPAPPPPVRMSRARTSKKDAKAARSRKKAADADADAEDDAEIPPLPLDGDEAGEIDDEIEDEDEVETEEQATEVMPLRMPPPPAPRPEPEKPAAKPVPPPAPVVVEEKSAPIAPAPKEAPPAKPSPPAAKPMPPLKKAGVKVAAKAVGKIASKAVAKKLAAPAKTAPAKTSAAKPVPAKKAATPAKKATAKAAVKLAPAKKTAPGKSVAPTKKVVAKYALGRQQTGRR